MGFYKKIRASEHLCTRSGSAVAGRVAWRSSAPARGVTAAPAVASTTAPATTTAAGPRSSIAWASWAINFNTDVGSFSLLNRQNFRLKSRGLRAIFSGMLTSTADTVRYRHPRSRVYLLPNCPRPELLRQATTNTTRALPSNPTEKAPCIQFWPKKVRMKPTS